ncbi:MAG TPA: glycosyltransferase [Vicinamibacterales bacterium]|nr:glycosyltransferase [Vicinamibacterales bacterium]
MRFLLINNHCISDPTAGVTQSLRTIMTWLADAGHACHILTTARLGGVDRFTIEDHLHGLRVRVPAGADDLRRPVVHYHAGGVPVTLLLTRHNDETAPDPAESQQYLELVADLLDGFAPDQVIACNAHPMIQVALQGARARGLTTAFALRSYGYGRPYFEHVDHAFTCSAFLTTSYHATIGLVSTPLEPPIDWDTVLAPVASRAFVTFVHPAPHKGLFLFARLADMLGARRPDIPLLVVQSGQSAGSLHAIPGIDLRRYPQIMAAPPVPTPSDYLALTRILLVPSTLEEPFGRVAAEAMINGIPALVSNRGSLPHVVGGDVREGGAGYVLPLPDWLTAETLRLPSQAEVEPWFDAVCGLWDDAAQYRLVAQRAEALGRERYGEAASRQRHVDYFTSLKPGSTPFEGVNGRAARTTS